MRTLSIHFIVPFCFFLALCGLLWKALFLNPNELPSVFIDKPAPAFYLPTVTNPNRFITEKIFKGHLTLLNVWATWCIACQREHSVWMDIMASRAQNTLLDNVLFIGLNYRDTLLNVQNWLKKMGDPYYLTLFDTEGLVGIHYGVYGTPETFLVDKEGMIRYRHVGPIDLKIWQQTLLPRIKNLQE